MLLLFALLKILLLALSFKSGFVGLGVKRLMARRASGKAVAAPAKD